MRRSASDSRGARPRGDGRRSLACALALVGALVGALACGSGDSRPNILVITLDTTRADHLGLYGYFRDTSPALDALGRESIVFERAIAPMATTLPTHTSLLTSTYPLEHGVLANTAHGGARFVPAPELRSFASVAREAGYATAGFVGAAPLARGSGIETGFDVFDHPAGHERSGAISTARAIAWLRDLDDAPFLLWVHYFDAHWPFTPAPEYRALFGTDEQIERYAAERRIAARVARPLAGSMDENPETLNLYDAEIRFQDDLLKRLLDELRDRGLWQQTAILVVADHGEGLGQHGEAAHGGTWDEQLHIPLLMRVPGVAPRREPRVISMVDVLPTFLGLLAEPTLSGFNEHVSGRDVLSAGFQPGPVLSQDTGRRFDRPGYRYALTDGRWKYIHTLTAEGPPAGQLFDLRADPFELNDLSAARPEKARELRHLLEQQIAAQRARGLALRGGDAPEITAADPALLEQLRALGYVDGDHGGEDSARAPQPGSGTAP